MTSKPSRAAPRCETKTASSPAAVTHPTIEIDPSLSDVENAQSLFDALVRYVAQTFYEVPKSSVLHYIYHHGPVTENDLTRRLDLSPKLAHQYLEDLTRERLIIRKGSGRSSTKRANDRTPVDLSYRLDIAAFVDLVRSRLTKMRVAVEEKDRQRVAQSMDYTCQNCCEKYSCDIVVGFYDPRRDCIVCQKCSGTVRENDLTDGSLSGNEGIIPTCLFNDQMTPLYDLLQKIDQIVTDEVLMSCSSARYSPARMTLLAATTLQNRTLQVILEPDELFPTTSASVNGLHCSISQLRKKRDVMDNKGSPPWFTRPLFPDKESPPDLEADDNADDVLERSSADNAARLQEIRQVLLEYEGNTISSSSNIAESNEYSGRSPAS